MINCLLQAPRLARTPSLAVAFSSLPQTFVDYVVPSYGRYTHIELSHGAGNRVWDTQGKSYLDFGGGIAVNSLGHAHPAVLEALQSQAGKLMHCSNLYLTTQQGELAERLVNLFGGEGKVFFCNSGAEANEGLFKLAKRFGLESGRHEIITAENSFHGRTLAAIAATGQDKIKAGFGPMVPGFVHVPFNDLDAVAAACTTSTAAVLVEGIQGEGGVTPASAEYLLGLRKLCDDRNMLLMMDGVQCGHFRSGRFQSYQQILGEDTTFRPDAMSMAKSIGAGFPMGAFWAGPKHADLLSAGSHGTTYGGNPLGCAVAQAVLDVVEKEGLEENVRTNGTYLLDSLKQLQAKHAHVVSDVRGLGFMLGIVLHPGVSDTPAADLVEALHQRGMLTVPAGANVCRLLPALNTTKDDIDECLSILDGAISETFASA
jgi:acetylornithine aminotransferase/acetylornithine/N-succinyldiaminopimelate aminotransferase